jgi:hypothetical protein
LASPLSYSHPVEDLPLDHATGARAEVSGNHNAMLRGMEGGSGSGGLTTMRFGIPASRRAV